MKTDKKIIQKRYRDKNKSILSEKQKEYRKANKDKVKDYNKEYKEKHKDRDKDKKQVHNKTYSEKNKEKLSEKRKEYYKNNKEKIREYFRNYKKKRKEKDKLYFLKVKIRNIIYKAIIYKTSKNYSTEKILGCSFEKFKLYIESKFEVWMSWDNYGKYNGELNYGWDIDHIIPISSASNEEEIIKLNHYTNLQPLCSKINRVIKRNNPTM